MGLTDRRSREWLGRRAYALLAGAFALFVIYGSLLPFQFHALPLDRAVEQYLRIFHLPVVVDSRADLVTNVLLFIPLGYLVLAGLRTDRAGRLARVAAGLLTVTLGCALSLTLEMVQEFLPRTVALSDVLAETFGNAVGVMLWLALGDEVTAWVRDLSREHERPALVQRLLLAYCFLFVLSQLMPFDLTISLGELAHRYRQGRIVLQPFGYVYASWSAIVWDYLSDMMLNVPVGAAAVLLWTAERTRRPSVALVIGVAAVGCIELGQVFVYSRVADVTDVLTGSAGMALGVAMATRFSGGPVPRAVRERREGSVALARIAALSWLAVLVSYHWDPFRFSFARDRVLLGMHQLLALPFSSYYAGAELHALTEMSRKIMLALPLGSLLRFSWPSRSGARHARLRLVMIAAAAFCILFAIEVGQVFLPGRVPDVTDAIMGEVGVLVGLWLAGLLTAPQDNRAANRREVRSASLRP